MTARTGPAPLPAKRWRPSGGDHRVLHAANRRRPAASRPAPSALLSLANRLAR
ncbi:MAG: hypothetical protein ACYCUG_11540 [Acidimicrobiales bacterium]